jgi:hypothetical protein
MKGGVYRMLTIIYKAKGDYIQAKRKETREVFPKNSQGKEINRGYKITF